MATVTHRVTTPDAGNTPNTSGAFSPAVGDLLVVFVTKEASALSSPMASADLTSSVAPTGFTLIRNEGHQSSAAHVGVFVANALCVDTTSRTVTIANGSDAGAGTNIAVYSVSGLTRVGANAVRQSSGQTDQAAGTPAPVFGAAALTANPVLGCIYNATNPAGLTPPSGWTESAGADTGYTTGQVSGIETCFRNSGETGTTITWGSASASAFASIILELDTSALTFTADGAVTIGAATSSGGGTFSPPTYTAAGAVTTGAVTTSGGGTFTAPSVLSGFPPFYAILFQPEEFIEPASSAETTYTASGAVTIGGVTSSGSGTFTPPTYTAAGAVTAAAATTAGAGTFTPPTYEATGAVTTGAATASGTGIFSTAVYQATGAVTSGVTTTAGAGTFVSPTYTGNGAATTAAVSSAGSGTVTNPVYSSNGAVTSPAATSQGSGIFATAVFTGLGSVTAGKATTSGIGTFTVPQYTGNGNVTTRGATTSGIGTFQKPFFTGQGSANVGPATTSGIGTFTPLTYSGNGAVTTAPITSQGAATFVRPTYTGVGNVTIRGARTQGNALGTTPDIPPTDEVELDFIYTDTITLDFNFTDTIRLEF